MRIHTLQGLYLYVENLLQAIISLVKTRSYPNTTCPSYVFLFSQAICHQAEFPAAWHRTAVFSCPALLPAGKGDKYGTGEKRMPWGTFHQQRQTVFCHCLSEHIGRIWNPQPIFQGLHRTERNITYQTIGRAEKSMLRFEGFIDCLSFLTLKLESCPQSPDFDRQDYMVLNSVANVSKALYPLGSYERIHCFLDNDRAGMEALQQIRKEYDNTRHIRDASHIYSGCKDLNEYLQKQTETKKQAQSIKVKTPPNKPGGFWL